MDRQRQGAWTGPGQIRADYSRRGPNCNAGTPFHLGRLRQPPRTDKAALSGTSAMAKKPDKTAAKAAQAAARSATKRPASTLTDGHAARIADALEVIAAHLSANAPAAESADIL